jgi:hypothetical protein
MFESFTRRHHLDHFESDLQYEDVPPALRYDLFKIGLEHLREEGNSTIREYVLYRGASIAVNSDYHRLYGEDDIMEYYTSDLFIDLLQKSEWHEVLSIIEYFVNDGPLSKNEVNKLLDYHNVGYEVENKPDRAARVVVKYTSLIKDNERILSAGVPYAPAVEAITAAKEALIDPKKIDVATSVSLSVAAVEAYLRGWLDAKGQKAPTLGDAIKTLRKLAYCPSHIIGALEQFYIYRNRTENVGHGAPKFAEITREDALLCNEMAISFINYFHRKERLQGN